MTPIKKAEMTKYKPLFDAFKIIFLSWRFLALKIFLLLVLCGWYIERYIFPLSMNDSHMEAYFEHRGFDKNVIRRLPEYTELKDFIFRHKKSLMEYRKAQNRVLEKDSACLMKFNAKDTTTLLSFRVDYRFYNAGDFSKEENWKKYKQLLGQDPHDIASLPDSLARPLVGIWSKIGERYISEIYCNIDNDSTTITFPGDQFDGKKLGDTYWFNNWLEWGNNTTHPTNYAKESYGSDGFNHKKLPNGWEYFIAWDKTEKD